MNKVLICIGSNARNKKQKMSFCRQLLLKHLPDTYFSHELIGKAYGDKELPDYMNQLAIISSSRELKQIQRLIKRIEKHLGRNKIEERKKKTVKIDIDLLKWNKCLLKPKDIRKPYVQTLLKSIK